EGGVVPEVDIVADGTCVQDHAAVVPDPHPPADARDLRQGDATRPFDHLVQEDVDEPQRRPNDFPAEAQAPVAKAMYCNGPEPLFEPVAVMGAQVLAQERDEADVRRVQVTVALLQRKWLPFHLRGAHASPHVSGCCFTYPQLEE